MDTVLSTERIFFAEGQFPPLAIEFLASTVQRLGGTITLERNSSTILIIHPSSPLLAKELENIAFVTFNHPNIIRPIIAPYHWLSTCALGSVRLPLSDLAPAEPYFINPNPGRDRAPLQVWVSVNVQRQEGEEAMEAHANVTAMLQQGGAVSVTKRADADVLVVDMTSMFSKTVKAEKERHGRDWQRLVERDWVEACVRDGRLIWAPTISAPTKEEPPRREDSFDEEPIRAGSSKGPGRPTGKPRTEYSPQDDDFLCRYLASFHPDGSWHSRKTFQLLVSMTAEYPIAGRHSDQSWQERFKKNAAPFSRRVQRLVGEGVDRTLKTEQERTKAATATVAAPARMQSPTVTASVPEDTKVAASSETTAEKEGARLTGIASRSLEGSAARSPPVDAQYQSDAPLVQTVSIDVPVTAASPSTRESNRKLVDLDDDDGHAPDAAMKQNTERAEEPIVKITDAEGMVGLSEQPALVSVLPENETDIAAVDRALPVLVANPQITGNTRDIQALPEADARLLLDIPAESQAVALHGSTSSPRRSTPLDDQSVTAFIPLDGRSPKRKAIRSPDASPTHPASDLVLPRQSFSAYDAGASPSQIQTTRIPSPLRSELDERDVTTVDQVRPQTTRIPFPLRSELDERDVTTDGDQIRRQTPSPIRNRTTLREEIMSSAGKRRRALERPAHKGDRHSPDKVYVSTSIPATQPTPEPIAMKGQQLRSSSPALSPAQRKDRILAGEKLVHGVKEQYRTRISGLSEKYNVKPTDLFKLVNEMPKRDGAGGQVYWMDVEERLRIHYGY